jgi:predicted acylesterase/phospholipase RssA
MNKKYDGIVLEAGGIKGIALLGFLDILYNDFNGSCIKNLKYMAGTSCGSAITFLLSIGYTPREIFMYITINNDILDIFSNFSLLSIPTQYGMVNSESLKKYLELMAIKKIGYVPTFNDIYIKFGKFFMCPAYNITGSSKEESCNYFSVISHGDMYATDAVILSCSIPLVFTKSMYNNNLYIDGAVFDGCPVKKLIELSNIKNENILCLRFSPEKKSDTLISSVYYYIKKIFESFMESTRQTIEQTDQIEIVEIEPGVGALEFDLSKPKRMSIFLKGQETARKYYNIVYEDIERNNQSSYPENKLNTDKNLNKDIDIDIKEKKD